MPKGVGEAGVRDGPLPHRGQEHSSPSLPWLPSGRHYPLPGRPPSEHPSTRLLPAAGFGLCRPLDVKLPPCHLSWSLQTCASSLWVFPHCPLCLDNTWLPSSTVTDPHCS